MDAADINAGELHQRPLLFTQKEDGSFDKIIYAAWPHQVAFHESAAPSAGNPGYG